MENAETQAPQQTVEPLPPSAVEPADAVLLRRFVHQRDEAAFTALVERYGPLVLGVCMRILNHRQDAEDAFQSTFLVLARKASSITRRASVGGWIYRVAYRLALKARSARARRAAPDSNLPDVAAPDEVPNLVWRDLRPVLDEEVNRLPLKYRLPVILCYLEGKTNVQAAAVLNCPPGTVMSRLAWARERLRSRLTRRGVALSTGALAVVLGEHATAAALPAGLAGPTVANALRFAAGRAGEVVAQIAGPAQELLRAWFWTKWAKSGASLLAVIGLAILGVWLIVSQGIGQPGNPQGARPAAPAPDDRARLQGFWIPERLEAGGQALPRDGLQVAFLGDTFQMGAPNAPALILRFALDSTAQPPTIDLYQGNQPFSWGIYRLDGDTLWICYAMADEERPNTFDSSKSGRTLLYQLRRQTP